MKQMIAVVILLQVVILAFAHYYYTVLHNMIQGLYHFDEKGHRKHGHL